MDITDEHRKLFSKEDIDRIQYMRDMARMIMNDHAAGHMKTAILAGGCFYSWYHNENPKDVDIYINDKFDKEFIEAWIASMNKVNPSRFKKSQDYAINNNIIDDVHLDITNNYQYIITKPRIRKEIVETFDFVHCMISYSKSTGKLYVRPDALDCIKNKVLRVNNPNRIADYRIKKFLSRGFKFDPNDKAPKDKWDLAKVMESNTLSSVTNAGTPPWSKNYIHPSKVPVIDFDDAEETYFEKLLQEVKAGKSDSFGDRFKDLFTK